MGRTFVFIPLQPEDLGVPLSEGQASWWEELVTELLYSNNRHGSLLIRNLWAVNKYCTVQRYSEGFSGTVKICYSGEGSDDLMNNFPLDSHHFGGDRA